MREPLPNRRMSENIRLKINNTSWHITRGFYADGRPGEYFANGEKAGTDMQVMMRDFVILLSIASQYGVPIEVVAHAICRREDGSPESPFGQIIDMFVKGEAK